MESLDPASDVRSTSFKLMQGIVDIVSQLSISLIRGALRVRLHRQPLRRI